MESRLDEALAWLARAREALEAGAVLLEAGHTRDVVSRSYYAMFYAAKAAVVSEGLETRKHSTVISQFGQRFAKTGRVSIQLHSSLNRAFDERQLADYALDWDVDLAVAQARLDEARGFVSEATLLLGSKDDSAG